jgi:hypothetical protein
VKHIDIIIDSEVESRLIKLGGGDINKGICRLVGKRYDNISSVDKFVNQHICKSDLSDNVTLAKLFSSYEHYCSELKITPIKKKYFKLYLEECGFIVRPGGGNVLKVYGLILEDIFDEDEEW